MDGLGSTMPMPTPGAGKLLNPPFHVSRALGEDRAGQVVGERRKERHAIPVLFYSKAHLISI